MLEHHDNTRCLLPIFTTHSPTKKNKVAQSHRQNAISQKFRVIQNSKSEWFLRIHFQTQSHLTSQIHPLTQYRYTLSLSNTDTHTHLTHTNLKVIFRTRLFRTELGRGAGIAVVFFHHILIVIVDRREVLGLPVLWRRSLKHSQFLCWYHDLTLQVLFY